MSETKHKRGELSECGKFAFWGYQSGLKKDGTRGERWIPVGQLQATRQRQNEISSLAAAQREWKEMQAARRAA